MKKHQDVFELLDRLKRKVKQEKQTKSYRLFVFNSLWQDGYSRKMGPAATCFFLILGDKCTREEKIADKLCLFVYGGAYLKTIIQELADLLGKAKPAVWRYLKRLKELGWVDYKTRRNLGTRIVVFPIPGAFERHFNKSKNVLNKNGNVLNKNGNVLIKNGNVFIQPALFQESAKENKRNPKIPETENPPNKDLNKDHNKDNNKAVAEIFQILNREITPERILELIKGKDPELMIKLAKQSAGKEKPVGYWITLVKGNARATENKPKEEVLMPKHEGTGIFAFCPEEVVQVMRKKFQGKELELALWKLLSEYHDKFEPVDFHKFTEALSGQERARILDLAKKEVGKS
ncbi:hypothetical protein ES705_11043 [subsurface metagenome]